MHTNTYSIAAQELAARLCADVYAFVGYTHAVYIPTHVQRVHVYLLQRV